MAKYKILVVPSDNRGGVGFYRSLQPHKKLSAMFPDDFDVTFDMNPDWTNFSELEQYDLICLHKGLYKNMVPFYNAMAFCKERGIPTVLDIDDHWCLDKHHPNYLSQSMYKYDEIIKQNLKIFSYITTTTPLFADEIRKVNPKAKVFVLPNAIDPTTEEFTTHKTTSDKVRVGLVMGSSHEHDMELLNGVVNSLSNEVKNKIQIVLCGFDTRGTAKFYNKDTGERTERPMQPQETVWYRYERNITDNWKLCSPEYKHFLDYFISEAEFPNVENEHYRRCWTKDLNHYFSHYDNIDVLLAPLQPNDFNKVKSQLKCIEACFSHTAIIASEFGPYTIDLKPYFLYGGQIDENGNALLVKNGKDHKDWKKYIEKLVLNPDLLKKLQDNLYEQLHEKYDLATVTANRAEYYKEIIKENIK